MKVKQSDIFLALANKPIKNSSVLIQAKVTGFSQSDVYNRYVQELNINDIRYNYYNRCDNPRK